jgi:hypothetical protein
MMTKKALSPALALAALLLVARPAAPQGGPGQVIVHLADGTTLPLNSWSLSYEYQAYKEGTQPGFAQPTRRESADFWSNKKVFGMAGGSLEIQYRLYDKPVEVDGQSQKGQGAVVTGLVVNAAGKRSELKREPPAKELLMPGGTHKGLIVQARSLDVRGETLTGTRRDFCVMSYSPLVECSAAPKDRVVKLEFPR